MKKLLASLRAAPGTAAAMLLLAAAIAAQALALDIGAFAALNRAAAVAPDWLWENLTALGDSGIILCLLSPALLLRPQWVMAALAAVPLASLFSYAMKSLFHGAPRPGAVLEPGQFHLLGELFLNNSFPSGHSITAFAVAAAILRVSAPPLAAPLRATVLGVAAAVACSRIAVGAHWPVDAVAGAAGGWICGTLGAALVQRWPRLWQGAAWKNGAAVLVALAALWISDVDMGYPLAQPLQRFAELAALAVAAWQLALGPLLRHLRNPP